MNYFKSFHKMIIAIELLYIRYRIIDMCFSDSRPGTGARRIHSLQTAQDSGNYTEFVLPKNVKELKVPIKSPLVWPETEMIWRNRPIKKAGRKAAHHILKGPAGEVKPEYKNVTEPEQSFDLFFDEEIMTTILGIFKRNVKLIKYILQKKFTLLGTTIL